MTGSFDGSFYLKNRKFWKFRLVALLMSLGIIAVVIKLVNIQLINHNEYRNQAKRQHESKIDLSAERGKIVDRNGKVIASTVRSLSVAVDPKMLQDKKRIAKELEKITGVSAAHYIAKIETMTGRFVWLKRGMDPLKSDHLKEIKDEGLLIIEEPKRVFNYGATAAQVVGLTNIDNQGLTGIELAWDSLLIGRNGYMIVNRDARGFLHPMADLPMIPAINGYSLELTIDIELQRIIEHELKKGVERTNAMSATAIAIQPNTGDILAMCSYPNFNPNNLVELNHSALKNKAVTDIYEPGSTFKVITAAAVLEEGLVHENDTLDAHNGYYGGRGYAIRDVHGYDSLTFRQAMEKSSNIVLANLANEIPKNKFYKYIRDFGFGLKSGIEFPGEVAGIVPKPEKFTGATKRFLGHGYEISVTPLQMAMAYSAIANGGNLMKPRLIKKVTKENGEAFKEFDPEKIRRVISGRTANRVRNLCIGIVDSGTGTKAKVEGLKIGGKTGTSQQLVDGRYSKSEYYGSFAGFFPGDDPQIVLLVVVDAPRGSYYGGTTAAPIFKSIASSWINNKPINDNIHHIEKITAKRDSLKMINLIGLTTEVASMELQNIGLSLNYEYEGIIVDHIPAADSIINLNNVSSVKAMTIQEYAFLNEENIRSINLKGLTLRRATALLSSVGVDIEIEGSGIVHSLNWEETDNGMKCKLICK